MSRRKIIAGNWKLNMVPSQAVELAKKFGGDESPSFVNGVLAKLV